MPMMGRHGEGTIVGPDEDGRYVVAVTMEGGRRVYRRARNAKAADKLRRDLIRDREAGIDPSNLTLADFLRSWLGSLRDGRRVRDSTLRHYTLIVERHIVPALGRYRLSGLSERHVQKWLDQDGASARTVHHHRAVLRRALNVALRQRAVGRNVALGVELPDVARFAGSPLTLDDARTLLASSAGDRLGALWRLALDTGLRQAELLGLGWDDIDFDAGTVTVTAQLVRVTRKQDPKKRGGWVRAETKAGRSLPTLALFPETVEALRRRRLEHGRERKATWRYPGLVFSKADGEAYHQADILREFRAACVRAGITPRRFHDIRASTATLMRELGVPEDVRMSRLGHNTTTMARHYAKAGEGQDREASDRLGKALGG